MIMKVKGLSIALLPLLLAGSSLYAQNAQPDVSSVQLSVTVDDSAIIGPVKPMNAVNNGPYIGDSAQMADFRILNIPYSRTHDASEGYYGQRLIDISEVFPDFSKDPDKASSYDFRETDIIHVSKELFT